MQPTPRPRRTNLYLYLFLGLFFGLLLAIIASIVSLLVAGTAITWNNIVQLHLSNPLILLIDLYAIIFAIVIGFIGNQRDKTAHTQAQLHWLGQKRSADLQEMKEDMLSQDQKYKELEAIISRGKQQWEATFDAVKDLIVLTDENGIILRCNRATGEVFQTGFSHIIGRQVNDLFLGAGENDPENLLADTPEIRFPSLEGWYQVSRNFLIIDGQQGGWVYVFRDISDRKQDMRELQRLNQYYQLLVKNSPIAVVTLNQDERVVDINPAFETIFGYDKREVLGWNIDSLICPPALMAEMQAMAETIRQGERVHKITQRQRKDGSLLDMEFFGIPVIIGDKQVGALRLYHNVSELVSSRREAPVTAPFVEEWSPEEELPGDEAGSAVEVLEEVGEEAAVEAIQDETISVGEQEPEEWLAEETTELKPSPSQKAIPIEKIEGIGPVYASKLAEEGIKTTDDLLKIGGTRKEREELSESLGISGKLILKWVNMADLMRVKGIGEEYSELLEKAGVDTVRELCNRIPENLHAALIAANEEHKFVRRPPHLSEVENWVQSAKELEPLVTY